MRHKQPDGQITQNPVHPFTQKYSARAVGQINDLTPRVSPRYEGRVAIVTNARWDAVDAECAKDERAMKRTAKSCGPDAAVLASVCARGHSASGGDGDKTNSFAGEQLC